MSRRDSEFDEERSIAAGYAMLQLSKALISQENHPDPAVRARAAKRIMRWQQVIMHTLQGTAEYGSRTPFPDIPTWVTPEVTTGGFATGNFLAGGELTEYECELALSIQESARASSGWTSIPALNG
jgi:hypothetical protein